MIEIDRQLADTALTFTLDGETFGIPVSAVAEVIDPLPVTPVPAAPVFAPGLVNIRGVVAPLVDLGVQLGLPSSGTGPESRMLVLDIPIAGEMTKVVALADSVDTITGVPVDAVEPVPDLGTRWAQGAVRGIMKRSEDIVALLDIERIFNCQAPADPERAGRGQVDTPNGSKTQQPTER